MTEADDARWWSQLRDGRDDAALQVPEAVWDSALSAALGGAQRPELDDLVPDDRMPEVAAAAAHWVGATAADWPADEDIEDLEHGSHFVAADEADPSFGDDRPHPNPHSGDG